MQTSHVFSCLQCECGKSQTLKQKATQEPMQTSGKWPNPPGNAVKEFQHPF